MTTKFCESLTRLCNVTGITMQYALIDAAGLTRGDLVKNIQEGWIPDMPSIEKLALYFGVGVDEFVDVTPKLCYLIGPITGRPDFMAEHKAAKAYLESLGKHVCSPALVTSVLPKAYMKRKHFMDLGLGLLQICDEVATMPHWKDHSGCRMEMAYAQANGLPVTELIWAQISAYLTAEKDPV